MILESATMKILVINGPNINMLGIREKAIYGSKSYADLLEQIESYAKKTEVICDCFQSNHEGVIVDKIQEAYGCYDGIVINPAAYTHTSVAILDALKAINIPTVEVHISDIAERESFRNKSFISDYAIETISGKGFKGYEEAILYLVKYLSVDRY